MLPGREHGRLAVGLGRLGGVVQGGRHGDAQLGQERAAADDYLVTLGGAADAGAWHADEVGDGGQRAQAGGGGPGDGEADGML
jgi:hypothetical protein